MIHATALPGVRCPALRGLDLGGWKRPCVCVCVCECRAKCGRAGACERGIVGQSSGPSLASLAFLPGLEVCQRGGVEMGSPGQGQQDLWPDLHHMLVCACVLVFGMCE